MWSLKSLLHREHQTEEIRKSSRSSRTGTVCKRSRGKYSIAVLKVFKVLKAAASPDGMGWTALTAASASPPPFAPRLLTSPFTQTSSKPGAGLPWADSSPTQQQACLQLPELTHQTVHEHLRNERQVRMIILLDINTSELSPDDLETGFSCAQCCRDRRWWG